jgi:hypothetical protein
MPAANGLYDLGNATPCTATALENRWKTHEIRCPNNRTTAIE